MLRSTSLRVLRPEDLADVQQVLQRDPVADVFVASRVEAVGLDPARLGGEMWAAFGRRPAPGALPRRREPGAGAGRLGRRPGLRCSAAAGSGNSYNPIDYFALVCEYL